MVAKRLNIELPLDLYEFLRKEAAQRGMTISGLIRQLIEDCRSRPAEDIRKVFHADPFSRRHGSFDGPHDLAEQHDRYLYRNEP